jgi:hypothetical protein
MPKRRVASTQACATSGIEKPDHHPLVNQPLRLTSSMVKPGGFAPAPPFIGADRRPYLAPPASETMPGKLVRLLLQRDQAVRQQTLPASCGVEPWPRPE